METVQYEYYPSGNLQSIIYKKETAIHRSYEIGPAVYLYYDSLVLKSVGYYENGKLSRPVIYGPAYTSYYENGNLKGTVYMINGSLHRPPEQGPASTVFDKEYNNEITSQQYYIHYSILLNSYDHSEYRMFTDVYKLALEEYLKPFKSSIQIIEKNWKISKWNKRYREFLTQVLYVPENHDSPLGKLFPKGGFEFKKIKTLFEKF